MKAKTLKSNKNQKYSKGLSLTANWTCNKLNEKRLELFKEDIEKIEKNLKTVVINIRESNIDNLQLNQLKNEIQKLIVSEIFHLNLICCKIEDLSYVREIIAGQNKVKHLKLELGSINMFDNQVSYICQGLYNGNTNITRLMLHLGGNTIQDNGLQMVINAISQYSSLQYLDLDIQQNRLGAQSGIYIAEGLRKCQNLISIKFNFTDNYILTTELLANSIEQMHTMDNLVDLNISTVNSYSNFNIQQLKANSNSGLLQRFFINLAKIKQLRFLKLKMQDNILEVDKLCYLMNQVVLSLSKLQVFELPYYGIYSISILQLVDGFQNHQALIYLSINISISQLKLTDIKKLYKTKRLVYFGK